jgi:hypothetical protein
MLEMADAYELTFTISSKINTGLSWLLYRANLKIFLLIKSHKNIFDSSDEQTTPSF